MKNLALIAALIGIGANAQAHEFVTSNSSKAAPASITSNNIGRIHGYTIPFAQTTEVGSKGRYADTDQFGRLSAYDNAINKKHDVSKGVDANVGQFGRLSGYGKPVIVDEVIATASK